jgi:exosortase/archaeosortase family protein
MDAGFSIDRPGDSLKSWSSLFDNEAFFLLIQLVAFWNVWQWIAARFLGSGDVPWELIPLIAVVFFSDNSRSKEVHRLSSSALVAAAIFLAAYVGSILVAPPLVRAILAVISVTFIVSPWRFGSRFHLGVFGLLLLSLPLIDSLNFFLGYPMRVIVGEAVAYLLNLQGLDVYREGAILFFGERMISIDAPCSGVKMLWFGSLLATVMSLVLRINNLRLLLVYGLTFIAIILGNILRASALFYVEGGLIESPEWTHSAIGVISFAFTAMMILFIVRKVSDIEWRK